MDSVERVEREEAVDDGCVSDDDDDDEGRVDVRVDFFVCVFVCRSLTALCTTIIFVSPSSLSSSSSSRSRCTTLRATS